jgi:hypothetical protein
MNNILQPNQDEMKALVDFKSYFGSDWKDELAMLYYGGGSFDLHSNGQALQQVIKREGLEWLQKIEISDDGRVIPDPNPRPENVFRKLFVAEDDGLSLSGWAFHVSPRENLDSIKGGGILAVTYSSVPCEGASFHAPKSAALMSHIDSEGSPLLFAARIEDLKKCGDLVGEVDGMDWQTSLVEYGHFNVNGNVPASSLVQIHSVKDLSDLPTVSRALDAATFINQVSPEVSVPSPKSNTPS